MTLASHTIQADRGARKGTRRLGRGHGSGRGKSAGRGTKGQRARTGGKSRTSLRPLKRLISRVPKLRGFTSLVPKKAVVTLRTLERIAPADAVVTPAFLKERGVIHTIEAGVKVVGNASLTKKITLQGITVSKGALAAIEKAGGSVVF